MLVEDHNKGRIPDMKHLKMNRAEVENPLNKDLTNSTFNSKGSFRCANSHAKTSTPPFPGSNSRCHNCDKLAITERCV